MSSANERQVGGAHYQSEYQHWDFVEDCGLGYLEGQITKYASRHDKKNGRQDLEKAGHFIDKLMECAERGRVPHNAKATPGAIRRFCDAQGFNLLSLEGQLIEQVCMYYSLSQLADLKLTWECLLDARYPAEATQ